MSKKIQSHAAMFESFAKKYLEQNGRHLAGLVTVEELCKAGAIAMITEEGEHPCYECEEESWNKGRYKLIQKAFGNTGCRRYSSKKDAAFNDEKATFINWVVTAGLFYDYVMEVIGKEFR